MVMLRQYCSLLRNGCCAAAWVALLASGSAADAETIRSALVQAYQHNPQLNAQRAQARVVDENVPQALSGYRPTLSVTSSLGETYTTETTKASVGNIATYSTLHSTTTPWTVGVNATQTLFNGFQTANRTRAAEGQVFATREALRVMEQTILLNAATAYMDVLRDTANLEVQRSNVRVLEETLKQTRDRFNVGEVTKTDVAQAEAQLAAGQSAELQAEFDPDHVQGQLPANHRHRTREPGAGIAGRPFLSRQSRRGYRSGLDPKSQCHIGHVWG